MGLTVANQTTNRPRDLVRIVGTGCRGIRVSRAGRGADSGSRGRGRERVRGRRAEGGSRSAHAPATRLEAREHRTGCLCRGIQELRRLGTLRFPRPAKAGRGLGRGADALSRAAEPLSRRASRVGLSAAGTSGSSRPAPTQAASRRPRPRRGAMPSSTSWMGLPRSTSKEKSSCRRCSVTGPCSASMQATRNQTASGPSSGAP
jgi:hypothetical protein